MVPQTATLKTGIQKAGFPPGKQISHIWLETDQL